MTLKDATCLAELAVVLARLYPDRSAYSSAHVAYLLTHHARRARHAMEAAHDAARAAKAAGQLDHSTLCLRTLCLPPGEGWRIHVARHGGLTVELQVNSDQFMYL